MTGRPVPSRWTPPITRLWPPHVVPHIRLTWCTPLSLVTVWKYAWMYTMKRKCIMCDYLHDKPYPLLISSGLNYVKSQSNLMLTYRVLINVTTILVVYLICHEPEFELMKATDDQVPLWDQDIKIVTSTKISPCLVILWVHILDPPSHWSPSHCSPISLFPQLAPMYHPFHWSHILLPLPPPPPTHRSHHLIGPHLIGPPVHKSTVALFELIGSPSPQ